MININLIAGRRSRKLREMMFMRWAIISVLVILIGMGLLNGIAWFDEGSAHSKLARMEDNLHQLQEKEKLLDAVQAKINEQRPQIILMKQAQQSEDAWLTILADLSRITPSDVVLTGINTGRVDNNMTLQLTGFASDPHTVGRFMIDLRTKTAWAGNPRPGTVVTDEKPDGQKTVHFDLTIPINGMFGGDI